MEKLSPIVLEMMYPVGAIYLSIEATSPSEKLGGTWERVQGANLYLASGSTTGFVGSKKISTSQMPAHSHYPSNYSSNKSPDGYNSVFTTNWHVSSSYTARTAMSAGSKGYCMVDSKSSTGDECGISQCTTTASTGGGADYTPYSYAVYAWKRIA